MLDGLWSLLPPPLEVAAELRRIPVGPGPLDAGPAGDRVAGWGDAALAAALATGGRPGSAAQIAHERSRGLETGQVAACGAAGDGHGELDAAHGLEGLDDGGETPPLARRSACSLKALAPVVMCRHSPDVRLEDARLGGRGTDHGRQPAPLGRPPGGTALIPDILAQAEGLHPGLGGLALPDPLRTRAGQGAEGLVLDRRDIDRCQIAGTPQPGAWGGVASSGVDAVARVLRDP